jgi:putative ABC transport system substrate-binding protein
MLRVNTSDTVEPGTTLFRNALAALGQVDGRNIHLENRLAEGHSERLPEVAQSLVRDQPAVIVALGEAATRAAQQATKTIPIVTISDDLVEAGLVASLAKPGGNTTGLSILATELDAKKIELLNQLLPSARRFGVLRDPSTSVPARMQAIGEAARVLGIGLQTEDVARPADFEPAFAAFRAGGAEGIDVLASPLLFSQRHELTRLSRSEKLPAICQFREMAEAGCLASYGISLPRAYAALADFTDKVLKGMSPSDIPFQQPTLFEFVINLQTARLMGIDVPKLMLARAEDVIE